MIKFTGKRSRHVLVKEFYSQDSYGIEDFKPDEIDTFLDIGANVGLISLCARFHYRRARIFALEPCAYTFKFLTENTEYFNIHKYRIALGNGDMFYLYEPKISVGESFCQKWRKKETDRCQSMRINDILKKFNLPTEATFVKIDCEGAEAYIMEDDPSLLKKCKRIAIETHTRTVDAKMREWTAEHFQDTHDIYIMRDQRFSKLNEYRLTRKD